MNIAMSIFLLFEGYCKCFYKVDESTLNWFRVLVAFAFQKKTREALFHLFLSNIELFNTILIYS